MANAGNLTAEQLDFFDVNGYLILESFSSKQEVRKMRDRMAELLDGFDGSFSSIFSTKNQQQHTDDYFFQSAENISFFFEGLRIMNFSLDILRETFLMVLAENAFGADGHLKQPKELSINKVGHGLSSSCHANLIISMFDVHIISASKFIVIWSCHAAS
ncbi:hypothetical protein GW17_00039157 [Ensete ventricosum]|nr:hypothetical protein GW17_00039157 [Ensete ventricosum]